MVVVFTHAVHSSQNHGTFITPNDRLETPLPHSFGCDARLIGQSDQNLEAAAQSVDLAISPPARHNSKHKLGLSSSCGTNDHMLHCNVMAADVRMQSVCAHSKDLTLPRASHSGEIALSGSRCLRHTHAAAPALLRMLLSQKPKTNTSATPTATSGNSPRQTCNLHSNNKTAATIRLQEHAHRIAIAHTHS